MPKRRNITIRGITRTPARLRRMAVIAQILTRHGFDHIVRFLHIDQFFPSLLRAVRRTAKARRADQMTNAQRLVVVLEELGPTAIKLGQLLSTRPDIIPEEYTTALKQLQDHVEPFDNETAFRVIEEEIGRPITEAFVQIDDAPMAAGSIGQVYGARLHNGQRVVVKVKRPDIDRMIRDDLDLLALVATQAERVEELRPYCPVRIVEELAKSLQRELDFVTEASYTAKFGAAFEEDERVSVPQVHWEYTTSSVLVLEHLTGVSISHSEELAEMGIDRKKLANTIADVFVRQYFEMGLFHADPHPGNLLVDRTGMLSIIDFGMVGHLDDERRNDLSTILIGLVRKDLDLVVDVATEIGAVPDDIDIGMFKADLVEVLDKYYGVPLKRIDMKKAFGDVMRITREHGLELPQDFVLLGKSFVTVTGEARTLDPDLDLAEVVRPHATQIVRDKFSPLKIGSALASNGWQIINLLRRMPREMRQFSRKMLAGRLQIVLKHQGLEDLANELDRATNRIVFAMIVAAVVIGPSLVIHAKMRPHFGDLPAIGEYLGAALPELSIIGFAGYLLAGFLGMVLSVAIWRSGKL